jgi:5-hydroxyisourate hydrolase
VSVSTHVLDVMRGTAAAGLEVTLSRREPNGEWNEVARAETDADGRILRLSEDTLDAGDYRLLFATQRYFERSGLSAFYPEVAVIFTLEEPGPLHVPLLLSPFGYTTYKGV